MEIPACRWTILALNASFVPKLSLLTSAEAKVMIIIEVQCNQKWNQKAA